MAIRRRRSPRSAAPEGHQAESCAGSRRGPWWMSRSSARNGLQASLDEGWRYASGAGTPCSPQNRRHPPSCHWRCRVAPLSICDRGASPGAATAGDRPRPALRPPSGSGRESGVFSREPTAVSACLHCQLPCSGQSGFQGIAGSASSGYRGAGEGVATAGRVPGPVPGDGLSGVNLAPWGRVSRAQVWASVQGGARSSPCPRNGGRALPAEA